MLNHCTSVESFFLIWKSGLLSPQKYRGGDSKLKQGENVIFCFEGSRRLSFQEVVIFLPENITFETGFAKTWEGYENEAEYYVRENVSLANCSVKLHKDFDLNKDFEDFQYNFTPRWDENFNAYSDENEKDLKEFFSFLTCLEQES